jgi:hypothetical protein
MEKMYKLFIEGTSGMPEVVPGLMFTQAGAEWYVKEHRLTAIGLMPVEEYRHEQAMKRQEYSSDRRISPGGGCMQNIEYIEGPVVDDGWRLHFNKDVDWMPRDRHGIAKIPTAKIKSLKPVVVGGRRRK